MNKLRVLLVDDTPKDLKAFKKGLEEEGLEIIGVQHAGEDGEAVKSHILETDEIHAVLLDLILKGQYLQGPDVLKIIRENRPELPVFALTISQEAPAGFDGYFYKEDVYDNYASIARRVTHAVNRHFNMPFYEQLKRYVNEEIDPWHTPGHSSGDALKKSDFGREDVLKFFKETMFLADLSVSVPGLDSLLEPHGVIAEAHRLAAEAFGAKHTFFLTNGTSTANKIVLQTVLSPGEKILVPRNCHKSVFHGIILSGASPVYLPHYKIEKYGILGPVLFPEVEQALKEIEDVKAILLTNCTYHGLTLNLSKIVNLAHERQIKVIVDEAWYGYARFHPQFYPCAMDAGADYATHSTHKVMSALSQASMIHVADPAFDKDRFLENLQMHTSTSPQYLIIASLDIARRQMVTEGYKLLSETLKLAKELRENVNAIPGISALELEDFILEEAVRTDVKLDPTKVTISVENIGLTGSEMARGLLQRGIQLEMTTHNTILVLVTIGTTHEKVQRLISALKEIVKEQKGKTQKPFPQLPPLPSFPKQPKFNPQRVFYSPSEWVELSQAKGRIAAEMITPYPPGIPILVPGDEISQEAVEYLKEVYGTDTEVHGGARGGRILRVLTQEAVDRLQAEVGSA